MAEILCLFIFNLNIWLPLEASNQTEQSDALVQVMVSTAYDDSEESLKIVSKLIELMPVRRITLPSQGTLSELILNEYRLSTYDRDSVSYRPRTYSLLEKSILSMNEIEKPEDIKAGEILIPYVPKKALQDFNPEKRLNYVPRISVFEEDSIAVREIVPTKPAELEYKGIPQILDMNRRASQIELLDLEIPLANAQKILSDEVLKKYATVFNYPMTITLANCPISQTENLHQDHQVMNETERNLIQTLLAKEFLRNVCLFIVDTGWPDAESYEESRRLLRDILSFIWEYSFQKSLPRPPKSRAFKNPSNTHCQYIARALKEFRSLDPESRIRVIYIPMTKEQDATPVLEDILQTHYIIKMIEGQRNIRVTNDIIKRARKIAKRTVDKAFPSNWGNASEMKTDKVILDALLSIGNLYAREKETVFLINESWTVIEEMLPVYYPSDISGGVVAAAGNANENITYYRRDFSQRCINHRDTVAVMNMDPKNFNFICNSSRIAEDDIDRAMAIAYDGRLNERDKLCGTSFAAPRVAWIIAVAEATRACKPPPYGWGSDLCERLMNARNPNNKDYSKLWFDPIRFLSFR